MLAEGLESGPRQAVPAPGHTLWRVVASGADRAGIVAGICRTLAEHDVNIADLASRSRTGQGGSPHYEMTITVEVPERRETDALRAALEAEADRLVIEVELKAV